ncbi:alanine--tRNA ligase [Demequina sp. SYSU T00039]|uniref:Alanine--tRNA ligase n=1 Tax=Demequina lignilytica TaxID=3051663 RepID=A0AAW7LZQ9_9MICO|nr:alanine--tRNA ligase [Demequina sp. SYSU T00039]MDN4486718.1 alanine--tRNA ligase [Demequina sp. SYSU T00039]
MQTSEIATRWVDYFAKQDHHIQPSASLVSPDPSLLFTVAGMVPFIPYIIGTDVSPHPRIASVQKCIRTKDIEEVGKTTRHGSFFQMLGNFSFGDYFKEGAINYAWEFLTGPESEGNLGFDPERFWVTVWNEDHEAISHLQSVGVDKSRIVRLTREENFWDTGQPGPAGPCAEWHYDRGPEFGPEAVGGTVDPGGDRYLEIWNLVFDQYLRGEGSGKDYPLIRELDQKAIDTGAGLERIAYLKQGVANMYETDEVFPVIAKAQELSGKTYGADGGDDVRMRVVADHVRSALMLIGDGVTPGNEGRGYVLRRLIRRSVRAMKLLGVDERTMPELLPASLTAMSATYPELEANRSRIEAVAYSEEDAFRRTLTNGTTIFDTAVTKAKADGAKALSGADAFELHDTYGFPIDITLEMASEQGIQVDEAKFRELMKEQKERARADAKAKKGGHADVGVYNGIKEASGLTEFRAYEELNTATEITAIIKDGVSVPVAQQGETVEVILPQTPFYAESGGQEADSGVIRSAHGTLEVIDVQKPVKGLIVHTVNVVEGEVAQGDQVSAEVDPEWRLGARQAHSGTHLLHASLREVLGPDALQSGSYNKPGYLRLDFSWPSALSPETRSEIEEVTNRAIRADLGVSAQYMTLPEAKEWGAVALFGETYDETVRVIQIGGPWSRELCGGTHVEHSSQVGMVAVSGESSVGSGSRRIEAFVGIEAFQKLAAERALVSELTTTLKVQPGELRGRVEKLLERLSEAEKQLAGYRQAAMQQVAAGLVEKAVDVSGIRVVTHQSTNATGGDDLRNLVTDVRARLGEGSPTVVAIAVDVDGRPQIVVATNAAAREVGLKAGDLVKTASSILGGGGGGKPDLAQGGGQDASKIPAALEAVAAAVGARA